MTDTSPGPRGTAQGAGHQDAARTGKEGTSDAVRVAVAVTRARDLLAESHQPLTMTPGDVRALLARTQRRLQELADAADQVTTD